MFDFLDNVKDIAGNGTEGQKRILTATQALKDSTDAAGMNTQDWDNADTLVKGANAKLDEADKLFASIISTGASLDDARKKAQPEIDAAQADIARADGYLQANKNDVASTLVLQLDAAKKLLKSAAAELSQKQPNYLFAVKQALAANL